MPHANGIRSSRSEWRRPFHAVQAAYSRITDHRPIAYSSSTKRYSSAPDLHRDCLEHDRLSGPGAPRIRASRTWAGWDHDDRIGTRQSS